MAYKIHETVSAQMDLDNIIQYLVYSLENPVAAKALLNEVESCYNDLERLPMMYEACHSPHLKAKGFRKAVIRKYIMVYAVNEATKTVEILRFFHGSQDYEKNL